MILNNVSDFFDFKKRSATFKKEIIGGLSTFLAMAYILAVNPGMMSDSQGGGEYTGVFFLATAVASMVATLAMGLYAKVPIAVAPGMGVNAFFAYTVAGNVLNLQVQQALVATFCSGVFYAIIAVTPFRNYLARILPRNVKLAIGAMIGMFLAYIGLSDAGIIVTGAYDANGTLGVATNTKFGNIGDPFVLIAISTMLIVFVLHFLKIKGAAIVAMISAIIMLAIAYGAGVTDAGNAFKLQHYDSFSKFGQLSGKMWSSFGSTLANGKAYIAIFVFLYIDFFDTTGTLFSVGEQAGLNKDVKATEKWMTKANVVDAGATMFGSVMLTSTVTAYVESSVGVSQGARTGFASVVTGMLFALAVAIWPIMSPMLPIVHDAGSHVANATIMPVTGPILVLVGALMISQLKWFNWKQSIDIPMLFVTLIIGMLAYSISAGIAAGVIVYYVLNLAAYLKAIITHRPAQIDDEAIVFSTHEEHSISNELPDLKKRVLNPVMILMVTLALVYFGTMPLYAF